MRNETIMAMASADARSEPNQPMETNQTMETKVVEVMAQMPDLNSTPIPAPTAGASVETEASWEDIDCEGAGEVTGAAMGTAMNVGLQGMQGVHGVQATVGGDQGSVDKKALSQWLNEVGLGCYLSNLWDNGYDSLEYVRHIADREDLVEVGIMDPEHQMRLMRHIHALNAM